jgi:hypothetical protein
MQTGYIGQLGKEKQGESRTDKDGYRRSGMAVPARRIENDKGTKADADNQYLPQLQGFDENKAADRFIESWI